MAMKSTSACIPVIVTACIFLAGALEAAAEDWPCWRGPDRNGVSKETGWIADWPAGGPKVLWKAAVGTGFSSFAVAAGKVYTLGNSHDVDTVFCLDAVGGQVLWKHSYPCDLQPLSYEGGPSATPAVDGQRVFTFSKSGDLFCLGADTGKVLWSRKFPLWPRLQGDWQNTWRYAGSPLVLGDRLVLSLGQAGAAFNPKTGAVLWQSEAGHPGYSSPVPFQVKGRQFVAFFSGHAVAAVDPVGGRPLWRIPWNTLWDLNAADPVFFEDRMFVSSGNGVGCALFDFSKNPPQELWRNKSLRCMLSSAVLWKGRLFGFDEQSGLVCMDGMTGNVKWSQGGLGKGSLMMSGGRLILLSESGTLVVADASADAYRPLAQAKVLDGRCWTAPVLAQGRIYVRNSTGKVVCLDVTAK